MAVTRPDDPDEIQLEYATISARDQAFIADYLSYRRQDENADDGTLGTELLQLVRTAHLIDGDLVESAPEQFADESPGHARSLDKFFAYLAQRRVD